jgi:proteasome lid subunit RPN8/RPN11
MDALVLSRAQYQQIAAQLRAEWPNEACGILAGRGGVIQRVYPVENVRRSPSEYQMEPSRQIEVMMEIEAEGWELTGLYHSHPRGPATPSATDVAQAYYPDSLYVIFAPETGGEWRGRAFRIVNGNVTEATLTVAK